MTLRQSVHVENSQKKRAIFGPFLGDPKKAVFWQPKNGRNYGELLIKLAFIRALKGGSGLIPYSA